MVTRAGLLRRALGFSLVEVLAAVAITVMVLGIGLPAVSDSLQRQSDARSRMDTVALAHSKLEEFTALARREGLPRDGITNGLRWTVSVSEASSGKHRGAGLPLVLERIDVEVSLDQGAGDTTRLSGVRLKPARLQ